MAINTVGAKMLAKMFLAGAKNLENKKEWINELNVFPVPDGDTGTNMTMTIMAAAKEVAKMDEPDMVSLCKAMSSGSLRGARGNSGVILSQLLRGFTKVVREYDEVTESLKDVEKSGVQVVKYIYNMNEVMQAADLLVCRAGAITVSELNALGKPSVLIPSPNVTDNHQFYNAKALADKNAAVLIEEKELNDRMFFETVTALCEDVKKLEEMSNCSKAMGITNANQLIYEEIKKII